MAERLPKLINVTTHLGFRHLMLLQFDNDLTHKQMKEIGELVAHQFAGQLRRDPNAPFTAPPQPDAEDAAAERSAPTREGT